MRGLFVGLEFNPLPRLRIKSAGGAKIVGRRLARTAIRYDFVGDLLAFTQGAQTSAFDGADVNEDVVSADIRLNEAVALGRVKPLHSSHAHVGSPSQVYSVEARREAGRWHRNLEEVVSVEPAVPVEC